MALQGPTDKSSVSLWTNYRRLHAATGAVEYKIPRKVTQGDFPHGSLESFLLLRLIRNPAVEWVYTLSRPSPTSIEERQMSPRLLIWVFLLIL
jgi:hypothetical protein